MKVALFGGTGFVGSYLVDALVDQGYRPRLLVRPGNEGRVARGHAVTLVPGDVADDSAVARVLQGADAAIYNIGLLREFPERGISFRKLHFEAARRVINQAERLGVRRFLLMSANGVTAEGGGYQRTKYMAEQYLQTTDLEWTIFRPSVIFGNPRGRTEFATRLYRDIVSSPLPAPLFFTGLLPHAAGSFSLSPVHVANVAEVFVRSLTDADMRGRIEVLGGPESLSWKDILGRIAAATGKPLLTVPVPVWGMRSAAALLDRFAFFPVTREQLDMLVAGNTCDSRRLFERYGLEARCFDQRSLGYLASGAGVTAIASS